MRTLEWEQNKEDNYNSFGSLPTTNFGKNGTVENCYISLVTAMFLGPSSSLVERTLDVDFGPFGGPATATRGALSDQELTELKLQLDTMFRDAIMRNDVDTLVTLHGCALRLQRAFSFAKTLSAIVRVAASFAKSFHQQKLRGQKLPPQYQRALQSLLVKKLAEDELRLLNQKSLHTFLGFLLFFYSARKGGPLGEDFWSDAMAGKQFAAAAAKVTSQKDRSAFEFTSRLFRDYLLKFPISFHQNANYLVCEALGATLRKSRGQEVTALG